MNPIIVALDVESADAARELVRRIGPEISFYKVGMELFCASGMDYVRELLAQGKEVFLDLKLYDIAETVKRTVAEVAPTGVRFLTRAIAAEPSFAAAYEARASALYQLHQSRQALRDFNKVLEDPNVDAVHINSPIPDHAPQSLAAMKAGKHVACTVPMATTVDECRQLVEEVLQFDTPAAVLARCTELAQTNFPELLG